jgi:hypothetical protein
MEQLTRAQDITLRTIAANGGEMDGWAGQMNFYCKSLDPLVRKGMLKKLGTKRTDDDKHYEWYDRHRITDEGWKYLGIDNSNSRGTSTMAAKAVKATVEFQGTTYTVSTSFAFASFYRCTFEDKPEPMIRFHRTAKAAQKGTWESKEMRESWQHIGWAEVHPIEDAGSEPETTEAATPTPEPAPAPELPETASEPPTPETRPVNKEVVKRYADEMRRGTLDYEPCRPDIRCSVCANA